MLLGDWPLTEVNLVWIWELASQLHLFFLLFPLVSQLFQGERGRDNVWSI